MNSATTSQPREITEGQELTHADTGARVRVLAVDADASCLVWVVFCDDPDRDALVPRSGLTR